MKLIPLTRNQFAKVDDEDFEELSKFKWHAWFNIGTRTFHARRGSYRADGGQFTVSMHRQILGIFDTNIHGDHINHDTLDNQRHNLRAVTSTQNAMNRIGANRNSTTGVRGVYQVKTGYEARIRVRGKLLYLGVFTAITNATAARAAASAEYFGEYGGLETNT